MASKFTVRAEDPKRTGVTLDADDLESAIDGAWRMQRHYEAPVEIVDNEQGRVIGRVYLEWLDD